MSFSDGGFLNPPVGHYKLLRPLTKVRRKWSQERKEEAIYRRDVKGETNIQIARAMGVSMASVSNMFQEQLDSGNIKPIKEFWPIHEDDVLRHLTSQGLPSSQIARKMKRTYSSIRQRQETLGIGRGFENEQVTFHKKAISACNDLLSLLIKHHGKAR